MGILAKLALIDWMAILCLVALAALAGAAEAGILGDHKRTAGFAMLGLVVVIVAVFATSRLEDSLLFGNPEQAKEDPRGKKKGDYGNVDIKKNGGAGGGAAAGDGSGPGDGSGGAEHKAGEGQGKPGANADAAAAAGDGKSKDDEKSEEDICGDGTGGKVKASNKKANAQAALPSVRAGSSQHDCPHCPRLAYVPRGCFDMGSPASQDGFRQEEGPQTRIKIGRAFYIGRYEVTRGEFAEFVTATGYRASAACVVDNKWSDDHDWQRPGFQQSANHPVVCVSWLDALAYVEWLSRTTGHLYRLPTEAEWEYAARAGGKSAYPHGATLTPADANFGYNSNATLPVGQFTPNAYGLLDMAGNVWELTQDCWEPSLDSMSEGGSARESGDCERRTMRGGAWYNSPNILRSASRWSNPMLAAGNGVGFRVVREAGPQGRASGESRRQATAAPAGPSDAGAGTAVRPAAQPVAASAGTGASATAPAQAAAAPPQATPARGGKNGSNSPQPSSNGRSNGSGASSAQRRGDDTSERPRERAAR